MAFLGNKKLIWLIILILAFTGILLFQSGNFQNKLANIIGSSESSILKLSPSSALFAQGERFSLDVLLDTKNKDVVAVAASLSYNPDNFDLIDISTSDSDFKSSLCPACILTDYDSSEGKIKIIAGKPTPGVKGSSILVARIRMEGKETVSPSGNNFIFDFSGAGQGKSRVILDDGRGTDILSGVTNGKVAIVREASLTISNVNVLNITSESAVISWETNKKADSKVDYMAEYSSSFQEVSEEDLKVFHSLPLISLSPNTTYYFIVESEDDSGNSVQSSQYSFKTLAEEEEKEAPPSISNINIENIGPERTRIRWETDRKTKASIYYMSEYSFSFKKAVEEDFKTSHSLYLNDLSPATSYYFIIEVEDKEGIKNQSSQSSFTTLYKEGQEEEEEEEEDYNNEKSCQEAGLYWYNGSCYQEDKAGKIEYLREKIKEILVLINGLKEQLDKLSGKESSPREETIPAGFSFSNDLFPGQNGKEVSYLQIFLRNRGFYPEGIISGYFGSLTKKAVIRFQEEYPEDTLWPWGLTEGTGTVGRTTRIKINEFLGK